MDRCPVKLKRDGAGIAHRPGKCYGFTFKHLGCRGGERSNHRFAWHIERDQAETNGRVVIQIFPNNQLGSDTDMLNQVRAGGVEFFTLSPLILSTLVPNASVGAPVSSMPRPLQRVGAFGPARAPDTVAGRMFFRGVGGDGGEEIVVLRLRELDALFGECRRLSDDDFLLLPGEEGVTILGGHWSLLFPRPVYFFWVRGENEPFETSVDGFGKVYRVGDADEMYRLILKEGALVCAAFGRVKLCAGHPRSAEHADVACCKIEQPLQDVLHASPDCRRYRCA